MIPPPPTSPLFPYTTLFRSHSLADAAFPSKVSVPLTETVCAANMSAAEFPPTHTPSAQDRKSTRLNSSRQIISYAVFCLKKKRNTTAIHHESIPEACTH